MFADGHLRAVIGGYGSGRRGGRATVEGCATLMLDINCVLRPVMKGLHGR